MERSGAETGAGECAVPPFAIYLNNVQLSIDYVRKLATSIGEALNRQACALIPPHTHFSILLRYGKN